MKNIFNAPVAEIVPVNGETGVSIDLGADIFGDETNTRSKTVNDYLEEMKS